MQRKISENQYQKSWQIYKSHSESFKDDLKYYYEFCKGFDSLELFAGYGRVSNFILEKNVNLDVVELSNDFAKYINIKHENKHVIDVLNFSTNKKFHRIFAAYDSFTLLHDENDIKNFFISLDHWLSPGGKISLNQYHHAFWKHAKSHYFNLDGETIEHCPLFDLSKENQNIGIWKDKYVFKNKVVIHEYIVRLYPTQDDIKKYLEGTNLKLTEVVHKFNNSNLEDQGWIDYILEK